MKGMDTKNAKGGALAAIYIFSRQLSPYQTRDLIERGLFSWVRGEELQPREWKRVGEINIIYESIDTLPANRIISTTQITELIQIVIIFC